MNEDKIRQIKETRELLIEHNYFRVEYQNVFISPEEAFSQYQMALINNCEANPRLMPLLGDDYQIVNERISEGSCFWVLRIVDNVRVVEGSHARELHKILNAFNV